MQEPISIVAGVAVVSHPDGVERVNTTYGSRWDYLTVEEANALEGVLNDFTGEFSELLEKVNGRLNELGSALQGKETKVQPGR